MLPGGEYPWASAQLVLPILGVTSCAAIAGWVGSRRVLTVALPGCSSLPRVVADPMRMTRSTIGLIVGITLITTFACVVLISCVISSVGLVSTMSLTVFSVAARSSCCGRWASPLHRCAR